MSAHSGKTSEVIRNHFPSGDQVKPLTSVGKAVAFTGSPPAMSSVQICELPVPVRQERQAAAVGREPRDRSPASRRRSSVPPRRRRPARSRSPNARRSTRRPGVADAKATCRPSGDTENPPRRSSCTASSNRSGRCRRRRQRHGGQTGAKNGKAASSHLISPGAALYPPAREGLTPVPLWYHRRPRRRRGNRRESHVHCRPRREARGRPGPTARRQRLFHPRRHGQRLREHVLEQHPDAGDLPDGDPGVGQEPVPVQHPGAADLVHHPGLARRASSPAGATSGCSSA